MLLNTLPILLGVVSLEKSMMNAKLLPAFLVFACVATVAPTSAFCQGYGGPDQFEPESTPAPKPRVRWQKPMALPEAYRSKDTNKDGQIGMYEWPKTDYATFRKLDLNRDGFLTAEELTRKPASIKTPAVVAAAKPAAPAEPAAAPATKADTPASTPAAAAATTTAPAATETPAAAPASTDEPSEAERQWEVVDKDKDGKVTEAEFTKSILTRLKFTNAGVAVTFPMTRDEFIRLYPAAK